MLMTAAFGVGGSFEEAARAAEANLEQIKEEERQKILRRKSLPPLKTTLGFRFDCKISLDSLQVNPYGTIRGMIIVENRRKKAHEGLRVQLEAVLTLVETTFKCGIRDVNELECNILAGAKDLGVSKTNCYSFSPIGCQILGKSFDDTNSEKKCFTLDEGTSTFPFSFPMSDDPLPLPFKKRQARLEFRVAAYLKDSIYFVKMDSVHVDYPGYRNLYPHVPEPLCQNLTTQSKGTLFTKKSKLIMKTCDSRFLPGEDITFTLLLVSKVSTTVQELKVSLMRQILFDIKGVRRVGTACIDQVDSNDMVNNNGTSAFSGKLNVPRGCAPTYRENNTYHICYHIEVGTKDILNNWRCTNTPNCSLKGFSVFLQWEVKVKESPSVMKGKAAVTIGTTRESPETVQFYDFADFQNCIGIRISNGLTKISSIESRMSDCSLYSLPPAYSQISSKIASLSSLETLPPPYEDLN